MLSLLYVASVAAFQQFDWVSLLCMCLHIYIGDKQVFFFVFSLEAFSPYMVFITFTVYYFTCVTDGFLFINALSLSVFNKLKLFIWCILTLVIINHCHSSITMVTCQWDFSVHKLSSTCSNWMSSHGKSIGDLFLNILHVNKCCS